MSVYPTDVGVPNKAPLFCLFPRLRASRMLDHRLSVREEHLKGVDVLIKDGILKFGGAFLAPEMTDDKGRNKLMGSVIFFEAESIEEVRKIVEADPYFKSGAWDREKLVIRPFVPAMPWPLR
ncbi:hypothetical protein EI94DRAFT_1737010 [Lactarius quietus]|nr:hypothetical protein EI94DRAFT_1737010 [Lactarius quietus]